MGKMGLLYDPLFPHVPPVIRFYPDPVHVGGVNQPAHSFLKRIIYFMKSPFLILLTNFYYPEGESPIMPVLKPENQRKYLTLI
jgi:hypothetical protein